MSRRKTLIAEPSVRIEDILSAREGKNLKERKINAVSSCLKTYVTWKKHVVQRK